MRTRSPLTQAAFKGQQSLNMSLPKGNSRACFVIGTRKGNKLVPVPVRSGRGDKFLFSNPLAYTAALKSNAYADWQAKEKALQGDESNWQTTYNRLLRNPAYDRAGKQCTTPAMGRIPPKPNVMSWEASELQANGQCVNLISARWRYTQVADAMAAIAEDGIMDEHSRWKRGGNKASCARKGALYSQSVDWVGGLCSVFGVSGERGCIQNLVKACKKRVHDECRGGARAVGTHSQFYPLQTGSVEAQLSGRQASR